MATDAFAATSFAWDTSLMATSTPFGSGAATWTSPEQVPLGAPGYSCTCIYPITVTLFDPAIIELGSDTFDDTVTTSAIASLPFEFFARQYAVTVDLTSPFTLTAVFQFNCRSMIDTDALVRFELTNFSARDITHATDLGVVLVLDAPTNLGYGTYVTAIPEPTVLTASSALAFALWHRRASPNK